MAKSSQHNCVRTFLECFNISSTIFIFCGLSIQPSTGAGTKDGGNSLSQCNMKVFSQISNRVLHIRNSMNAVFTLSITACILVFWPPPGIELDFPYRSRIFARVFWDPFINHLQSLWTTWSSLVTVLFPFLYIRFLKEEGFILSSQFQRTLSVVTWFWISGPIYTRGRIMWQRLFNL